MGTKFTEFNPTISDLTLGTSGYFFHLDLEQRV